MDPTKVKLILAVLGVAAWMIDSNLPHPDAQLISFIQISLSGLAAHTLTMVDPKKSSADPPST